MDTSPTCKTPALWLTDYDGTIKPHGGVVSEADQKALKRLGALGALRVVATGRSLFGFAKDWERGLDFDYLIFSSGIGICRWDVGGPGEMLETRRLSSSEAASAVSAAETLGFGFFAFEPSPDNHHFFYRRPAEVPAGFEARLKIYAAQNRPWPAGADPARMELSQLLIMVPVSRADAAERDLKRLAPGLSVVRSTSPFGDGQLWLEVYPPDVSKGRAAARLAASLGLGPEDAVALGNDYNDLDLLDWAGRSFVTDDAPAELLSAYPNMPSAGRGGLAFALRAFCE